MKNFIIFYLIILYGVLCHYEYRLTGISQQLKRQKQYFSLLTEKNTRNKLKKSMIDQGEILTERTLNYQKQYSVSVYLGIPRQKFELVIDTGSSDLWVQSTECYNCSILDKTRYDVNKSKSFMFGCKYHKNPCFASITYGSGSMMAIIGNEKVQIGKYIIDDLVSIGLTYRESGDIADVLDASGILGLGFDGLATYTIPSITSYMNYFTLLLDDNEGVFTIDSILQDYTNSSWAYLTVEKYLGSYNYWIVGLPKVTINNETICGGIFERCQAVLDTGTGFISVSKNIWEKLAVIFTNMGCTISSRDNDLFKCKQSVVPDIELTLGTDTGYKFTIPKEDYIIDVTDSLFEDIFLGEDKVVLLGLILSPLDNNMWILGNIFLKRYYAKYGVVSHEVWMTEKRINQNMSLNTLNYEGISVPQEERPTYFATHFDFRITQEIIVYSAIFISLLIIAVFLLKYHQKINSENKLLEKNLIADAHHEELKDLLCKEVVEQEEPSQTDYVDLESRRNS